MIYIIEQPPKKEEVQIKIVSMADGQNREDCDDVALLNFIYQTQIQSQDPLLSYLNMKEVDKRQLITLSM